MPASGRHGAYDYSVIFPTLSKPLGPATVAEILKRFDTSNPHQPLSDPLGEIAVAFNLHPILIEKILFENNQLRINHYRQPVRAEAIPSCSFSLGDQLIEQTPDSALIDKVNACRARTAELYHVHERDGAEVIFSSEALALVKAMV